mmetsp:Transcript_28054/g.32050  ORF Transcript_28054/g.32050 Transcript_28054/m.32050 type:complete len:270 (+) Transcript_28054:345-1154(+)
MGIYLLEILDFFQYSISNLTTFWHWRHYSDGSKNYFKPESIVFKSSDFFIISSPIFRLRGHSLKELFPKITFTRRFISFGGLKGLPTCTARSLKEDFFVNTKPSRLISLSEKKPLMDLFVGLYMAIFPSESQDIRTVTPRLGRGLYAKVCCKVRQMSGLFITPVRGIKPASKHKCIHKAKNILDSPFFLCDGSIKTPRRLLVSTVFCINKNPIFLVIISSECLISSFLLELLAKSVPVGSRSNNLIPFSAGLRFGCKPIIKFLYFPNFQ